MRGLRPAAPEHSRIPRNDAAGCSFHQDDFSTTILLPEPTASTIKDDFQSIPTKAGQTTDPMKNPIRKLARFASERLYGHTALHSFLKRCFLALPPSVRGRQMIWDSLVETGRSGSDIVVLQIGANDGEQSDPVAWFIRKHRWRAVLVEPVPSIFENLRRNYAGCSGLTFVNAAVSDKDEIRPFFYLDDPANELPAWAHGLGSFLEEEVVSHEIPGREVRRYLRRIDVPCHSLSSLLAQHDIRRVDVLIIDAQGYDHHIVKQIPFDRIKPRLIVYEHILLAAEDRRACDERLRAHGYTLESDQWDVLGTLSGPSGAATS
jgi:FkbM family methyltransferase